MAGEGKRPAPAMLRLLMKFLVYFTEFNRCDIYASGSRILNVMARLHQLNPELIETREIRGFFAVHSFASRLKQPGANKVLSIIE